MKSHSFSVLDGKEKKNVNGSLIEDVMGNIRWQFYSFLISFRPFEFQVVILLECFDTLHVYWNCLLFLIKILLLTLEKKSSWPCAMMISLELDFEAPCGS